MKKKIHFNIVDETYSVNFRNEPQKDVFLDVDITDIKPTTKNVTFKCDVPEWIYNKLLGTEPKYVADKFERRLTQYTLAALHTCLEKLSSDAVQQHWLNQRQSKKVILVSFKHESGSVRDNWMSGDLGLKNKSVFHFGIAHKKIGTGFNERYYSHYKSDGTFEKMGVHLSNNAYSGFKEIEWTQEREDYLRKVHDKFKELNENLYTFLGNLDSDKLDSLISGNSSIKLLQ